MFSPLGLPLAQALPASIQQKLGPPQQPQGQNAPENAPENLPTNPQDSGSFPGFNPAMATPYPPAEPSQPAVTGIKIPLKEKLSQLLPSRKQPESLPNPYEAAPNPLLPPEAIEHGNMGDNTPGHGFSAKLKQLWPFHRPQPAGQDGSLLNPEPLNPDSLNSALLNPDGSPAEQQPQAKGIMQAIPGKLGRLLKKKPRHNQPEAGQPLNPEASSPENRPQNHPPADGKQNGLPNQSGTAPPQRMTAPPGWKPGQGIVQEGPWAKKIEPLTVDQIFERKAKGWVVRAPKYSLKPDEIRVNYIRKQQECLENMIFALPWKDHDVINPFHTGPCNVTD